MKEPKEGDLLLVIKINLDGAWQGIYDGDAKRVWNSLMNVKISQLLEKAISLKRLQLIQKDVEQTDRIPRIRTTS